MSAPVDALAAAAQRHHALLVSGGDTQFQRMALEALANRVLGGDADGGARLLEAGSHPDLLVVAPEKGTIGVDAARAIARHFQMHASMRGRQVVLVHEAEKLNRNAANAILKTLEEPTPGALIVLGTTAPGMMLATIRSRCLRVALGGTAAGSHQDAADQALLSARDVLGMEQRLAGLGLAPDAALARLQVAVSGAARAALARGEPGRAAEEASAWAALEQVRLAAVETGYDPATTFRLGAGLAFGKAG